MRKPFIPFLCTAVLFFIQLAVFGQNSVNPFDCPIIDKRNNGNGQSNQSAGYFPGYGQNNPVAANIVGTSYQTVPYDPATKTGNINFKWITNPPIQPVNLPIISRVWITATGVTSLMAVKFGPPPPAVLSGGAYYVNYHFYVQNIPPQGTLTLEFTDPISQQPVKLCSYDLQTGAAATTPAISCAPTITTQPANQNLCGDATAANFTVVADGAASYQWQVSSDGGGTWGNVSNGASYSGATSATLVIANPTTYDGKKYKVIITGSGSCGSTTSNVATLVAKPKPTAQFATTSYCGTGSRSIRVDLTGTAPWSFTYTANGGSPVTVSGINASPYYFSVNPASATTYAITSVNDAYCSNSALTGNTSTVVATTPTITLSSSSLSSCYGASSVQLAYTSTTGSPSTYSITTGTRAMASFTTVTNATMPASSPITITIPANTPTGTYDFNLVLNNGTCSSSVVPFTITVNALPGVTASASSSSVCSGSSVTLTAAGATSYSWVSSPVGFASASASPSVSPTVNTTYTVTGTNAVGCTNTATISITVLAVPTVAISSTANSVCSAGTKVTLTASGANSYSWSGGTPSISGTDNFMVVAPTAGGTYTVVGTASNGCSASATKSITISGSITVSASASSATVCQGSSATLTASGASTYVWTPSATLSSTTGSSVTATPTSNTTYTVYGTNASGCTGSGTVTVNVTTSPVTTYIPEVIYCGGDYSGNTTLRIGLTTSPGQTYTWNYFNTSNSTWTTLSSNGQYSIGNTATSAILDIKTPANGYQNYRVDFTSGSCSFSYPITMRNLGGGTAVVSPWNVLSSQSICAGSTPQLLSTYGKVNTGGIAGVAYTYQWQSSTDGTNYTSIGTPSAVDTTYQPASLTSNMWYRVQVALTGSYCSTSVRQSNAVAIAVASAVSSNTLSVSNACAAGARIIGSTPSGGTGTFSYSWESSTSQAGTYSFVGGSTDSLNFTPSIPTQTMWYRRLVSSGNCSNATSTAIAINPAITNVAISGGQTICASVGALTNLTVSPSGGPSGSYTYVWESSTNNSTYTSAGNTTNTLSPTFAEGTKYYRVTVSSGSCTSTSNVATVVVHPNPIVSMSASATSVCAGASIVLTASGADSYSWTPNPSASLSSYTGAIVTATLSANTTYAVVGTNAYGCTGTSSNVAITYNAAPSQPTVSNSSVTTCSSTVNLGSYATGTDLHWYSVPVANESYRVDPVSSISSAGTYYAYSYSGSCPSANYGSVSVAFDNVSVTVDDNAVAICSGTYDLTQLQPAARSGITYEWYNVNDYSNSSNKLATPSSVSVSGTYYLFAKSNGGGCYGSSSATVLSVADAIAAPSLNQSSISVCAPSTIDLDSYYSSSAGLTYNWYTSTTPSGASAVLNKDAVSASGTYYLFATDANGCRSSNSTGLSFTSNPLPTATISSPDPYCGDVSRTLNVTTDATSPTYMWEESTDGGITWTQIYDSYKSYTGAATSALYISSTTNPILSGYYFRSTVTKSGCSTTSASAILVGQSVATVTSSPTNAAIYSNSNGTFSISYQGIAETIQWQSSASENGSYTNLTETAPYSGVDKSTMLITNPSTSLTGYFYRAVITNTCGSIPTSPAALTVLGPLPVTWNGFSVKKVAQKVVLDWSTSSEQNSDVFIVQHSNDSRYWSDLGIVKAAGNSMKTLYYSFEHSNPNQGENFYRILQKDFDGKTMKSAVQHIAMEKGEILLKIISQPVQHGMIHAMLSRPMKAVLFTQEGQVLQQFNFQSGYNEVQVSTYAKGMYYLKAENKVFKLMFVGN